MLDRHLSLVVLFIVLAASVARAAPLVDIPVQQMVVHAQPSSGQQGLASWEEEHDDEFIYSIFSNDQVSRDEEDDDDDDELEDEDEEEDYDWMLEDDEEPALGLLQEESNKDRVPANNDQDQDQDQDWDRYNDEDVNMALMMVSSSDVDDHVIEMAIISRTKQTFSRRQRERRRQQQQEEEEEESEDDIGSDT